MLLTWASSQGRPSLVLNFLQGIADSRITYSGGANGTRIDSSGVIVAATTPRFDYDPVTLAARGLLVEEARTNLLLRSAALDNAAWTTTATITADATNSPAGTTTADRLVSADGSHFIYQDWTGTPSGPFTASIYLRADSAQSVRLLSQQIGGSGGYASQTCAVTTQWQRFAVTLSPDGTGSSVRLAIDGGGAPSFDVYAWGAQLEAGSFPTSYIPTTSASVAKTADVGAMTSTNFSSFYNQAGGTLVASFDVITTVAGTRPIVSFDDNTANERIELYASGTDLRMRVIDGGATQVDMSIGTIAANTTYKAAISFAANDFAGCVNGGTVATDTSGTLPTPDRMRLGSNQAGNYQNGHLRSITYYPTARPNSLQALTA